MTSIQEPGRFHALVEEFGLPVFVTDRSGTIEYVSTELADHIDAGEKGPESFVGGDLGQFVPNDDATQFVEEGEDADAVTVRFEQWDGPNPQFDLCRVNGVVLGCPPPAVVGEWDVARVLEQLHDATNDLYRAESIDEGLGIVIEAAVDVLGFDWCLLTEAGEDVFEVRATSDGCPLDVGERTLTLDEGLLGAVYESSEARLTTDTKRSTVARPTHPSIRSTITVPVGSWGVFQAQSTTRGAFDEQDKQLAETLVAPLATLIERNQREVALRKSTRARERQRRQIEALHAVATEMKTAESREAVYETTIEAVEDILSFDICAIDEVDGEFLVPKAVGSALSLDDYYEQTHLDRQDNLGSLTHRRGETFVVDDLQEAGYVPAQSRYRSALSLPLDDWGVLQIVSESDGAFDETDRRLAELLAEHTVAAIDRIDRETELERRARELEQQNARLDEFAAIVSHDLKNPLNVAALRTEHALETGDADSMRATREALDRMETIIDNVLTLARQGDAVEAPSRVRLDRLVDRCWSQVPSDGSSVTTTTELTIEGDKDRLHHLFENLFRNAVEHSAGEVTIEIGALPGRAGFYVEDDGPGIDDEDKTAVFERGYTDSADGTGLGLAIVHDIVDAHGWDIDVVDADSGGARFEVSGVDTTE